MLLAGGDGSDVTSCAQWPLLPGPSLNLREAGTAQKGQYELQVHSTFRVRVRDRRRRRVTVTVGIRVRVVMVRVRVRVRVSVRARFRVRVRVWERESQIEEQDVLK